MFRILVLLVVMYTMVCTQPDITTRILSKECLGTCVEQQILQSIIKGNLKLTGNLKYMDLSTQIGMVISIGNNQLVDMFSGYLVL